MPLNGSGVEGGGAAGIEPGACGNQDAPHDAETAVAGTQFDASGVYAFFAGQVELDVEGTLCGSFGRFRGGVAADENERGAGVAIEGEGDYVEAALGLVIDTHGTLAVAVEGDAAEVAGLRRGWWRWRGDGDGCDGGGLLAVVVDDGAGDRDGAGGDAGGGERGVGAGAVHLAGGRGVAVGEDAVLRALACGGDGDGLAGEDACGGGGAGDGWRLEALNAEAGGALGLLAGAVVERGR